MEQNGNQSERASVKVLKEAMDLQNRKSQDYQNPLSRVRQADHYPRGVYTILDTINGKMLRMYSVLETMEQGGKVNFESIEDSAIDMINYASFLVAYMRGDIDGQETGKDIFNRRVSKATHPTTDLYPAKFRAITKEQTTLDARNFTNIVPQDEVGKYVPTGRFEE
jgi:hypothetical protein